MHLTTNTDLNYRVVQVNTDSRIYIMSNILISMPDNFVDIEYSSLEEAKNAIKQLKLLKKQQSIEKKEINQQQRQIKAEYTDKTRTRGSKARGSGTLAKLMRSAQTYSRDTLKRELANNLRPLEEKKQVIEATLLEIEKAIISIELDISNHSF